MTVTAADLKIKFPDLASLDDSFIELFLADAVLQVNATCWGEYTDLGVQYLTAHLVSTATPSTSSAAGAVTMEKVGDLQRSYGSISASATNTELNRTVYGTEYVRLRKMCVSSYVVVC